MERAEPSQGLPGRASPSGSGDRTHLGIEVDQLGRRINSFELNGREIFVMPDICHLLKNLKAALFRQFVILPLAFVEEHELPCAVVNDSLVKKLFDKEIAEERDLRRLYHLTSADMDPDAWEKMNVGVAIRFFSIQTASALECAAKEGDFLEGVLLLLQYTRTGRVTTSIRKT